MQEVVDAKAELAKMLEHTRAELADRVQQVSLHAQTSRHTQGLGQTCHL